MIIVDYTFNYRPVIKRKKVVGTNYDIVEIHLEKRFPFIFFYSGGGFASKGMKI